jgi:hypothetical protein
VTACENLSVFIHIFYRVLFFTKCLGFVGENGYVKFFEKNIMGILVYIQVTTCIKDDQMVIVGKAVHVSIMI